MYREFNTFGGLLAIKSYNRQVYVIQQTIKNLKVLLGKG